MRLQWREGMPGQTDPVAARMAPLPTPPPSPPPRPSVLAAPAAVAGTAAPTPATGEGPAKLLIVGPDINLSGEITACDRLVVEGSVQVTLNRTRAIEIAETGRFTNGKAEVDEAEIAGVYEGSLTVRRRLLIRATGRVSGDVRYGELEIERGGRLAGTIERLPGEEAPRAAAPPPAPAPATEHPSAFPAKLSA
jgi:cytoskeletal protein CcmA (bactofilin family)